MEESAVSIRAQPIRFDAFRLNLKAVRRFVSPLLILGAWQAGSMTGLIPATKLAAPSVILGTFWSLIASGVLWGHLTVSLERVMVGLALGVSIGAGLALVAGLSRTGEDAVDPVMQSLRTLPYLGMAPLMILWFGIGELPKLALVTFASAFPVYMTLLGGIRGVDPKLVEAAKVFGLNRWQTVRAVILPGALAPALVGLRYALGAAWLSLVVSEQINADKGIGYMIMDARDFMRTDVIVVGLLVYAILGLGTDALVRIVEKRALAWRPSIVGKS